MPRHGSERGRSDGATGILSELPFRFENFFDGANTGKVAIEACDAWQPVFDWLTDKGFDVKLVHPHKTRIIAEVKIKTDCRDSEALVDLIKADFIPEVHVPCNDIRELRGIVKQREKLVQEKSKYKNRIKAQLRKRGSNTGKRVSGPKAA